MSFYCPRCVKNWWPYETSDGACPTCGGGTRRVQEDGDSGRVRLRDARSNIQQTEVIDTLEVWFALPPAEPKRPLARAPEKLS